VICLARFFDTSPGVTEPGKAIRDTRGVGAPRPGGTPAAAIFPHGHDRPKASPTRPKTAREQGLGDATDPQGSSRERFTFRQLHVQR
jgi:hypothetical protein